MKGAYLGPEFNDEEIESALEECGAVFKNFPENELIEFLTSALIDEKAIG